MEKLSICVTFPVTVPLAVELVGNVAAPLSAATARINDPFTSFMFALLAGLPVIVPFGVLLCKPVSVIA